MTSDEKYLIQEINELVAYYENLIANGLVEDTLLDAFNFSLTLILEHYNCTIEHYHELLLEYIEEVVNNDD